MQVSFGLEELNITYVAKRLIKGYLLAGIKRAISLQHVRTDISILNKV
jgi:hypothetical protein